MDTVHPSKPGFQRGGRRSRRLFRAGVVAAGFLLAPGGFRGSAAAPHVTFSVDAASPAVGQVTAGGEVLTPDDLLVPGPEVHRDGAGLGLSDDFFGGDFDDLDAISFGRDNPVEPLSFSVDRVAVGRPGTAVEAEARPGHEEAAGDIFLAEPRVGGNLLQFDEEVIGLIPGFFGDDLDALAFGRPGRVYFSIDEFSASNGFGNGGLANDIFLDSLDHVFASGVQDIGLLPGDDLDALALWDIGSIGVLDPGLDVALFSITAFSPNALTAGGQYSPGDVLITKFDGSFAVMATAASIGLRDDDELDALAVLVPESGTPVLWGAVFLALGLGVQARRSRTRGRTIPGAAPGAWTGP